MVKLSEMSFLVWLIKAKMEKKKLSKNLLLILALRRLCENIY